MTLKSFQPYLLLFQVVLSHAQDIEVKGVILSGKDKLPVQGATIIITGSSTEILSDKLGRFQIQAPQNSSLEISKEGFVSAIVIPSSVSTEIIILAAEVSDLSTGYDETPATEIAGAVNSIPSREFSTGVISSPEQLIQGRVAGVQVTTGSGDPGSEVYTAIRGLSSIQITRPLFVLDGIPLSEDDMYASSTNFGRGTSQLRDPLNFINPSDIERIDILKDAASTAIYGSRGSRGVILIKTKDGSDSENRLQFNTQLSASTQYKYYDLLNRDQFLNGIGDLGGNAPAFDFGNNTDWQKEINHVAFSQKYDLSYSNKYKSGNYRVSFGLDQQPGIIQKTSLKKLTGRVNWNHSMLDNKFQVQAKIAGATLHDEYAYITRSSAFLGDLIGATLTANPTLENNPELQSFINTNPMSLIQYFDDNSTTKNLLLNLALRYLLTNYISIEVNGAFNSSNSVREAAISPELFFSGTTGNGRATLREKDKRNELIEISANYEKAFGTSNFEILGGYSFQAFKEDAHNTEGWGFTPQSISGMYDDLRFSRNQIRNVITDPYEQIGFSDNTFFITQLNPIPTIIDLTSIRPNTSVRSIIEEGSEIKDEMRSFFGKVNYSLRSRYFVNAILRIDESTLFGDNNRRGFFPSFSAAWRLSEESFIPDFFSELKFRIGIGRSGNQSIPHDAHSPDAQWSSLSISTTGEVLFPSFTSLSYVNSDLKWEDLTELNLGLDFGIKDNRLQGTLDIYRRINKDFLYYQTLSQPSLLSEALVNSTGKIITNGLELSLNYELIRKNNFKANLYGNIAFNKNELKDFNGLIFTGDVFGSGLTGSNVQRIEKGHPLYSFYLLKFKGFDSNGLGIYDSDGFRYINKTPVPTAMLNIGGYLQYKKWDVRLAFSGLFGHYYYSNTANAYFNTGSLLNGRNVATEVLTTGESPSNTPEVSTRHLEKASFFRMQNVDIGYSILFKQKPFKAIRTYFSGQNLFVWTSYSGQDPDIYNGNIGMDYSIYPKARIFTLGIQATF